MFVFRAVSRKLAYLNVIRDLVLTRGPAWNAPELLYSGSNKRLQMVCPPAYANPVFASDDTFTITFDVYG